jgi:hypothetical protein
MIDIDKYDLIIVNLYTILYIVILLYIVIYIIVYFNLINSIQKLYIPIDHCCFSAE